MTSRFIDTQNILTRITNHIPMVVFRWKNEDEWPVEYVTENVKEVIGFEVEDFTSGRIKYSDIIHDEDIERVSQEVNSNQKNQFNNYFIHEPYRLVRKDGEVIWVEDRTYIERNQDGTILFYEGVILEITNRIKAEIALEKSRKKYSDLFEKSADAYLINRDGKFIDCNQAAVDLLGYKSKEEIINTHPFDISPEYQSNGKLSKKTAIEMIRQAYERGSHRFEWDHLKANGEVVPVEVLLTYVTDEEDSKILHTTWTDISDRKQAEFELKESAKKFKDFTNMLPQIVYEMDIDGNFTYLNDYSFEMTGFPKSIMEEGLNVFQLIHPDDLPILKKNFELLLKSEPVPFDVYRIKTHEGTWMPVNVYSSPVFKNEELTGFRGIVVDISQEYEAKEKLRESEERYRTLADVTIEGIFLHELGIVLDANESLLKLTGYSREEIIGNDLVRLCLTEKYKPIAYENARKHATDPYRVEVIKKDGTLIHVELESRNVNLGKGDIRVTAVRDITERLKAEEALRQSEARFRSVLENTRDMAYQLNIVTKEYDYISQSSKSVYGFTPEELSEIGVTRLGEYVYPDDRAKLRDIFSGILGGGEIKKRNIIQDVEYRFRRKDGQYRWFNDNRNIIYNNEGNPVLMVGSVRDITIQKEAQIALEESEQRYRNFVSNASEGIYRIDFQEPIDIHMPEAELLQMIRKNAIIGEVNETLARMYGLSVAEMVGKQVCEFASDIGERIVYGFEKEDFQVHQLELEGKDINGNTIYLSDSYTLMVEDDQLMRIWGMLRDITERKKALEALKASEEKNKKYVNSAPYAIFVVDENGKYVDVNSAACKMVGYSREEFLNKSIVDIIPHDKIEDAIKEFEENKEPGFLNIETKFKKKDGTVFPIQISGVALSETRFMAFGSDISERYKAEEEKSKLQDQLMQAQKLESVGRLAGGVAHDFNNMLEVIIGNVELAIMDMEPSNPLYNDLQEIEKAAQRSADLTGQLLAFARKQTVSPKVLNLNTVVNGMLKMLGRLIGEDIELAWIPCNNIKQLRIDPAQIDQILANLCVNARDAIKDVGKVTIETQNVIIDEDYCYGKPECVNGEYILLAVSDNGSGIEKEVLDNLFEPFFTTKGLHEGTGLGLATVFGIVKQNKGFINVYSEVGKGTTFKIYLPAHSGSGADEVEHFDPREVRKGNETVLLVEDEPSILLLGKRMIEGLGYHVLTAGTPSKAVEISREYRKDIDLLITDVVMPEMNGRDLAKQVLKYHPTIKRLFMSGYTANVIAHHGVLDEGVHFIQKPFRLKDLAEKIRNAVDE